MSEVRLVRCPKCDNVLPEPSGYPVYKCGGCGTVLRAKKKPLVSDGLLEGSRDEKLVNSSNSSFDKEPLVKEAAIDMAGKSPARSSVGDYDGSRSPLRESGLTEFHGGLPKSPMRDRFLDDLVKTPAGSRGVSRSPMRKRGGFDELYEDGIEIPAQSRNVSKSPVRGRGGTPLSMRRSSGSGSSMRDGTGLGDLDSVGRSPARSMNGNAPKSPLRRGPGFEVEGNVEQWRAQMLNPKISFNVWLPDGQHEGQTSDNNRGGRRSTWRDRAENRPEQSGKGGESVYSDEHRMALEGSLDHPIHGSGRSNGGVYRDRRSSSDYVGGYTRSDVDGPSKYHPDSIYGYGGPRQSFESTRGPASVHELQLQRVELLRKYNELKDQLIHLDGDGVSSSGSYSEHGGSSVNESLRLRRGPVQQFSSDNNVQRPSHFSHGPGRAQHRADMYNFNQSLYDDRFAGQLKTGSYSNQAHLSEYGRPGYVSGRSLDFDRESYVSDTHAHHPACGCSLCYSNDSHGQYRHRRHGSSVTNSVSSHHMDLERYDPRTSDPVTSHTGPRGRSSHPAHHHPMTHEVASQSKRLCRPISGGAPFVLCNNCFQLLKLPRNFVAKRKNQQLQCGACSTVISFDPQQTSSDPLSPQKKPDSVDVTGGSGEAANELGPKHSRESFAATSTIVGSYDFDAGGYSFPSMNSEASKASKGHRFNPSLAESAEGFAYSPSRYSVDEPTSDTESVQSSQINSEMPVKSTLPLRPPPGSPLAQHLDYSTQFHISQAEKQILEKDNSPEGPLVTTDATETEVPLNEIPTTGLSQDSKDNTIESTVPGTDKISQSPIDALLKGFASLSGRRSPGRIEVYVNGQAISHRLVKKAEKLAGHIQPGDYWYDAKAGFWGVMGHRCFGIIPPFIQEFSFPMLEDCSGGDTAVYVNGRELQKRDLDLLAGRGLPTTRDKHYVVDISGKVLDEDTRDFVVNLGRLAPSVEKKKCGFGMQVPEQLDD